MGNMVKAKSYAATEQGIRAAVEGLKQDLQNARILNLENFYRAFIIALHTDSLWDKAKWR